MLLNLKRIDKKIVNKNYKVFKDCHVVRYFHTIDLLQLNILDSSLINTKDKDEYKYKYKLIGVVLHLGDNRGHYTYLSYNSENN